MTDPQRWFRCACGERVTDLGPSAQHRLSDPSASLRDSINYRCMNTGELGRIPEPNKRNVSGGRRTELAQRNEEVTIARRGRKSEQGYASGQVHEEEKQVSRTAVWRRPVCCQPVTSVCTSKVPWSGLIGITYTTFNSSELASQGRAWLLKEFSTLGFIKICTATP